MNIGIVCIICEHGKQNRKLSGILTKTTFLDNKDSSPAEGNMKGLMVITVCSAKSINVLFSDRKTSYLDVYIRAKL